MGRPPVEGLRIGNADDHVTIEVDGGRWEGTSAEAERVLTGLHYALARARPGIHIGSMLLNGQLWGAKFEESDDREAIREMRVLVDRLGRHLDTMSA